MAVPLTSDMSSELFMLQFLHNTECITDRKVLIAQPARDLLE